MGMRRHSTATLMGLTKKELVEYVRMAEHNQEAAEETLNQQAENVKDWKPVVYGRWELEGNDDELGCSYFCSNCQDCYDEDWFYVTGKYRRFKYCPNCGARMMEDDENE